MRRTNSVMGVTKQALLNITGGESYAVVLPLLSTGGDERRARLPVEEIADNFDIPESTIRAVLTYAAEKRRHLKP